MKNREVSTIRAKILLPEDSLMAGRPGVLPRRRRSGGPPGLTALPFENRHER